MSKSKQNKKESSSKKGSNSAKSPKNKVKKNNSSLPKNNEENLKSSLTNNKSKESKTNTIISVILIIILIALLGITFLVSQHKESSSPEDELEEIIQSNKRDSFQEQVKIITDYINIREEADIQSSILGQVHKNEIYTILDRDDDSSFKWLLIETSNGIKGYISGTDEYVMYLDYNGIDIDSEEPTEDTNSNKNSSSESNNKPSNQQKPETNNNSSNNNSANSNSNSSNNNSSSNNSSSTTEVPNENKETPTNKKVIDASVEYYCDGGELLNSSKHTCSYIDYTADSSIRETVCPKYYTPQPNSIICEGESRPTIAATEELACTSGSIEYVGGKPNCRSGNLYVNHTCPEGYELDFSSIGGNTFYKCYWKYSGSVKGHYMCHNGYKLNSQDICYKYVTEPAKEKYNCPKGYTLKDNKCYEQ